MKSLAFHSLLRWNTIILPILTTDHLYISLKRLGECTFWGGWTFMCVKTFLNPAWRKKNYREICHIRRVGMQNFGRFWLTWKIVKKSVCRPLIVPILMSMILIVMIIVIIIIIIIMIMITIIILSIYLGSYSYLSMMNEISPSRLLFIYWRE